MKRGATNNKGFSLVELIIVIAIMAILVGVMAPQLIKYIEKANVAADTQVADNVRKAIYYAMMDPEVVLSNDKSKDFIAEFCDPGMDFRLDAYGPSSDWCTCAFGKAVIEQLNGWNVFDGTAHNHMDHLKSTPAAGQSLIICAVVNDDGTDFAIYIAWSDRYGEKNGENFSGTYDELEDSRVIFVK